MKGQPPGNMRDLTGMTFGRLTAIEATPERKQSNVVWLCRCECGAFRCVPGGLLTTGHTKSCGCLQKDVVRTRSFKHGSTTGRHFTREYSAWASMKRRCFNQNTRDYKTYGAKGVTVSPRWLDDFGAFLADMGTCPSGMSLDRIDNTKNYEPGNCRWATNFMQARNMSTTRVLTYDGVTLCITDWARRVGVSHRTIGNRLKRGLTIKEALYGRHAKASSIV